MFNLGREEQVSRRKLIIERWTRQPSKPLLHVDRSTVSLFTITTHIYILFLTNGQAKDIYVLVIANKNYSILLVLVIVMSMLYIHGATSSTFLTILLPKYLWAFKHDSYNIKSKYKRNHECKAKFMVKILILLFFKTKYVFSSFFFFLVSIPARFARKKLIKYPAPSQRHVPKWAGVSVRGTVTHRATLSVAVENILGRHTMCQVSELDT